MPSSKKLALRRVGSFVAGITMPLLVLSIPWGSPGAGASPKESAKSQALANDQKLLERIGLQSSDVPKGMQAALDPDGTGLLDQPTLDLCGASFPSDKLRVARRQMDVAYKKVEVSFSSEAVLYKNASNTQQAFTELKRVAASCPPTFVPSVSVDIADLKTVFEPRPDTTWPSVPGVQRLAYSIVLSDTSGDTSRDTWVYLRDGRLLLGLYWNPNTTVIPIDGQTTIEGIVGIFELRLSLIEDGLATNG